MPAPEQPAPQHRSYLQYTADGTTYYVCARCRVLLWSGTLVEAAPSEDPEVRTHLPSCKPSPC